MESIKANCNASCIASIWSNRSFFLGRLVFEIYEATARGYKSTDASILYYNHKKIQHKYTKHDDV